MSRIFVIGDIHGCLNELTKLMAIVDSKLKPEDVVVFLGDYVDRGPDSKGVVDYLIKRKETHPNKNVFLRGNHEDMLIYNRYFWIGNGGDTTLKSYGYNPAEHQTYNDAIGNEHMKFFNETELFYQQEFVVCVHAGIDPSLPMEQQSEHDMLWERAWVGYKGDYFNDYFVVYGHTPKRYIVQEDNQIGIDTGCVFGGHLTCAVIHAKTSNVDEIIQVKSEVDY